MLAARVLAARVLAARVLVARHCIRLQRGNVGTELGPTTLRRQSDHAIRVQHASLSHAWR